MSRIRKDVLKVHFHHYPISLNPVILSNFKNLVFLGLFPDPCVMGMLNQELTERIIGCAMKVHSTLGPGYLESVYKTALGYELQKAGLAIESEKWIRVFYEDIPVGNFQADILVENSVLLELKANQYLVPANEV